MASSYNPYIPCSDNDESPQDPSAESNANPQNPGAGPSKGKQRVKFSPGGESLNVENVRAPFDVSEGVIWSEKKAANSLSRPSIRPLQHEDDASSSPPATENLIPKKITSRSYRPFSRMKPLTPINPQLVRHMSTNSRVSEVMGELGEEEEEKKAIKMANSQRTAQYRAERHSRSMGTYSDPVSKRASTDRPRSGSATPSEPVGLPLDLNNIPLEKLQHRTRYSIEDDIDEEDGCDQAEKMGSTWMGRMISAATRIVQRPTSKKPLRLQRVQASTPDLRSGQSTPTYERNSNEDIRRPKPYREGFVSLMLKRYNAEGVGPALAGIPAAAHIAHQNHKASAGEPVDETSSYKYTVGVTPTSSGRNTPKREKRKWYGNSTPGSTGSLASLVNSTTMLAQPASSMGALDHSAAIRPRLPPRSSTNALDLILGKSSGRGRKAADDSIQIQVHIAETIKRQAYLLRLCKALMKYGAPTHRLEEFMRMSAQVLDIEGQFLYIPGCMIVSFDDSTAHTTDVQIIRTSQGVDLGKLRDVHKIFKEVAHDIIGADQATQQLEEVMRRKIKYGPWLLVFVYGLASAFVGPFAFGARLIDLPISFLLGSTLGIMQLILASKSDLYSNIFEISAAVFTSFLARLFGTQFHGLFCFSALAQSAIVLILPGYTVLCGSLELQSRNIVAGSVRMVYAVIYSLFLGFGITVGTALYGALDQNATTSVTCQGKMPFTHQIVFVPAFTFCLIIINQGQWKQMPVMIIIAIIGFVVNHFSAVRFASNAQIANTLGALAIGVIGNFSSRFFRGLAIANMLPAIFVQVPSGLAAGGSLLSGVTSAVQITNQTVNGTAGEGITTVSNATQAGISGVDVNTMVFNVGYSMIQVAIGITVGLFLSALIVYPFGKKRSGIFSF